MESDLYSEPTCVNPDDGQLVFEPRDSLSDGERDRADLHFGNCPACQCDMDFDYLLKRLENEK